MRSLWHSRRFSAWVVIPMCDSSLGVRGVLSALAFLLVAGLAACSSDGPPSAPSTSRATSADREREVLGSLRELLDGLGEPVDSGVEGLPVPSLARPADEEYPDFEASVFRVPADIQLVGHWYAIYVEAGRDWIGLSESREHPWRWCRSMPAWMGEPHPYRFWVHDTSERVLTLNWWPASVGADNPTDVVLAVREDRTCE